MIAADPDLSIIEIKWRDCLHEDLTEGSSFNSGAQPNCTNDHSFVVGMSGIMENNGKSFHDIRIFHIFSVT